MPYKVAFIGLGVMGHRMLGNMQTHDAFALHGGWDPDEGACVTTRDRFPELRIAASADEVISDVNTDVVYIASPPIWHRPHVAAAIASGKPVFCEKPLGVDVPESRSMVDDVEQSGLINAVNFPFARGVAADFLATELAAGSLGEVQGVDLRLHFSTWPRDWQVHATDWLSFREQGGFVREVVSHYVFLTERLFGPSKLASSIVHYPDGPEGSGAETYMAALLSCENIAVNMTGSVGGAGPDIVEYTVWGSRRSYKLYDWNRLASSDGGDWQEALGHIADPREDGYRRMLDNFAAQLAGKSHTMASFREALSVQERIEEILA